MDQDEIDEDDYKDFLVGSSEEESDEEENNPQKIEEYRRKLLGDISEHKSGTGNFNDIFKRRDLKEKMGNTDKELEIKFNIGFGEDIG